MTYSESILEADIHFLVFIWETYSKLKILVLLENTNLITLSHSRSRFLCLFIKISQFLFILKLPINFFSVNGHECYKIINIVSSFLLKLKFILSLVSEVSKIYYLETFLSKKCKSIEFVPISAFPSFPEIGLTGTSVKI